MYYVYQRLLHKSYTCVKIVLLFVSVLFCQSISVQTGVFLSSKFLEELTASVPLGQTVTL